MSYVLLHSDVCKVAPEGGDTDVTVLHVLLRMDAGLAGRVEDLSAPQSPHQACTACYDLEARCFIEIKAEVVKYRYYHCQCGTGPSWTFCISALIVCTTWSTISQATDHAGYVSLQLMLYVFCRQGSHRGPVRGFSTMATATGHSTPIGALTMRGGVGTRSLP